MTFEDNVDVLNLLESVGPETPEFGPGVVGPRDTSLFERYPQLRYERLLIIERAIQRLRIYSVAEHPLTRAWIAAHGDVLVYFEPSGSWEIPAGVYWSIYDANRGERWSESVAWTAAQDLGDADECGANCFLSMLSRGPEAYWNRLPHGLHTPNAVALATRLVAYALTAVEEEAPTRPPIDSIRASLGPVNVAGKGKLLDLLDELERKAK